MGRNSKKHNDEVQDLSFEDAISDILRQSASTAPPTVKPLPEQKPQIKNMAKDESFSRKKSVLSTNSSSAEPDGTEPGEVMASVWGDQNARSSQDTPVNRRPRRKINIRRMVTRPVLVLSLIVILFSGIASVGYAKRNDIAVLFLPPSPFSAELKQGAGYPLYYPSKLPGTYKFETDSIAQPEQSAVVFRISDDAGNAIVISEQARNDRINFDALFNPDVKVDKFDVETGQVIIGTGIEGELVAHLITDKTWVIVAANTSYSSTEDIKLILNNLITDAT